MLNIIFNGIRFSRVCSLCHITDSSRHWFSTQCLVLRIDILFCHTHLHQLYLLMIVKQNLTWRYLMDHYQQGIHEQLRSFLFLLQLNLHLIYLVMLSIQGHLWQHGHHLLRRCQYFVLILIFLLLLCQHFQNENPKFL